MIGYTLGKLNAIANHHHINVFARPVKDNIARKATNYKGFGAHGFRLSTNGFKYRMGKPMLEIQIQWPGISCG